ncbi:MAG TPA: L,D-transpeptidase family protein [Bryobacteraceae bacterium]|jgi:lipoprotein-anchoring transpeptidase ErfK/SrfK|nr:L,D-transpeptidase family protein [Bryobacteraceae bacterium]
MPPTLSGCSLEDPKLSSDLIVARDFDLGMIGPPLSISMDFIANGMIELKVSNSGQICACAYGIVVLALNSLAKVAMRSKLLVSSIILSPFLVWMPAPTLGGAGAARPIKAHAGAPTAGSLAGSEIEDSTKTGAVGPEATGPRVVRAQILLDRARFSPGEIDGVYGDDFGIAVKGYQENHDLKPTGTIDAAMWRLLDSDSSPLLLTYTITKADEKGPFQPAPADIQEKAKMKWLGFETPEEELGEKFHSSPKLLAELNPGKNLDTAGERITVPNVRHAPLRLALRVVVSKSKRTVIAYSAGGKELAQYPATIGGPHDPLPIGHWTITSVVHYPWFNYDPELFWNADPRKATAILPPGPRNPAGAVWIGLSKEHYGIHGTPDPGHIRHGESAGCIRMTNWDVVDLSHMVRRGTPIVLEE